MIVTIDPVLMAVGPLAVRWFGVLALVGLAVAVWLSLRDLPRQHIPRAVGLDVLAWSLPTGLLVARVVHVLGWWDYYFTHVQEVWQVPPLNGLALWGGLLGGGLMAMARLRSARDPTRRRRALDVIAPPAALGIAIGRVGEFLDGQGQGLSATVPWATQYTSPLAAAPDFGVARHPAQLYDALIALGLFVVLRALPTRLPAGSRAAMFLVVYGTARLALGAVRLDPAFLFGVQLEQLLALAAICAGALWGLRRIIHRRTQSDEAGLATAQSSSAQRGREETMAA